MMARPFTWALATLCATSVLRADASPDPALLLASEPLHLQVDALRIADGILRARLIVPIGKDRSNQPVQLSYPQWIPGRHTAAGSVNDLVNLYFHCGQDGPALRWERHPLDMFQFIVFETQGCASLRVDFEVRATAPESEFFGLAGSATPVSGLIDWPAVVLYPSGRAVQDVRVAPTVRLPADWAFATSLRRAGTAGESITFETTTIETLVDSPVLTGRHQRELDITPDVAEVSRITPTVGFQATSAPVGTPWHAWSTTAAHGSSAASKTVAYAAKAIAFMAVDLLVDHHLRQQARQEFQRATDDQPYVPGIPLDQRPPVPTPP